LWISKEETATASSPDAIYMAAVRGTDTPIYSQLQRNGAESQTVEPSDHPYVNVSE